MAKRIIVDADGEIIGYELHSPFACLSELVADPQTAGSDRDSSEQIHEGAWNLKGFERQPGDVDDIGGFLALLRFEQRNKLAELNLELGRPDAKS